MRIGGVITGQNVSLAALCRSAVYCVCGKEVRGAGSELGAAPAPAAGPGFASLLKWLLAPSNATGKLQRKALPLAFSSSPCRQAFQMGLNEEEK